MPGFPAPAKKIDRNLSSRPRVFTELMAGSANLSREHLRVGFTCRAYEKTPTESLPLLEEGDLAEPANQQEVAFSISEKKVFATHLGPDCSSFSQLGTYGGTSTRTTEHPEGDGSRPAEIAGNAGLAIAIFFICLCLNHGVFFAMEHPARSKAWMFPFFLWLATVVYTVNYDGCAFGLRPADWVPAAGDIRSQIASKLLTSNPFLQVLGVRCQDTAPHKHEPILGSDPSGRPRSKAASAYTAAFCQEYASANRRAWLQRAEPKLLRFKIPTLEFLSLIHI